MKPTIILATISTALAAATAFAIVIGLAMMGDKTVSQPFIIAGFAMGAAAFAGYLSALFLWMREKARWGSLKS